LSVYDRWHLAHPTAGAKRCSAHRKVPSAEHGTGLRWQVRGTDPDGHPVRQSFEFEQDARDFDAELRAAVRSGTFVDERAGRVTFRSYAENWRKQRTHDHSTAEHVESMLRIHCYEADGTKGKTATGRMSIGQYPMGVLARKVTLLRDWVAGLDLEASSALLLIGKVTAVFDAAVDDRVIGRNPLKASSVSKPKRVKAEVVPWTAEQVTGTCAALPARLQALGWLGAVTGPRQGELFGLATGDVDFLRRTVHYEVQVAYVGGRSVFKPVKNRRPRTVPIAAPVVPVLSRHLELYPPVAVTLPWSEKGSRMDGQPVTRRLVFTAPDGGAWMRQEVNREWRPAWRAAGVPDRGRKNGMHVLRHTAASRWLSKGLNPAKVAAYLGDTLAIVVSTYLHFLPEDDEIGRAIMDDYVTPGILPSQATKCPENALGGAG
jgi:integrase